MLKVLKMALLTTALAEAGAAQAQMYNTNSTGNPGGGADVSLYGDWGSLLGNGYASLEQHKAIADMLLERNRAYDAQRHADRESTRLMGADSLPQEVRDAADDVDRAQGQLADAVERRHSSMLGSAAGAVAVMEAERELEEAQDRFDRATANAVATPPREPTQLRSYPGTVVRETFRERYQNARRQADEAAAGYTGAGDDPTFAGRAERTRKAVQHGKENTTGFGDALERVGGAALVGGGIAASANQGRKNLGRSGKTTPAAALGGALTGAALQAAREYRSWTDRERGTRAQRSRDGSTGSRR